jgi:hypothetical protein
MTDAADKLVALVRLLARQAARDAYAATQGMNDEGSHDPADGSHRAATPAREEQQNSTFQPKGDL